MAVLKHARNLPVRGHWLKIQLLVFVEVHEREVAADLAKTPLDRLPHLAHGKFVPRLTCSERRPFVRYLEGGVPVGVAAVAEHVEEDEKIDTAAEGPQLAVLHYALEKPGLFEHALVVRATLERPVHLDHDPVWGLESLVVVAVVPLVAAPLDALGGAGVAVLRGATKVAEGPVEQGPAVRERASLGFERSCKDGDHGHDAHMVEPIFFLGGGTVSMVEPEH